MFRKSERPRHMPETRADQKRPSKKNDDLDYAKAMLKSALEKESATKDLRQTLKK